MYAGGPCSVFVGLCRPVGLAAFFCFLSFIN